MLADEIAPPLSARGLGLRLAREAEVEELQAGRPARAARQEEVVGLDVAVDEAGRVRGGEDVERPVEDPGGLEERDRLAERQLVPEGAAGQELHHEERAAGAQLAVVVDGDGVRVAEPGRQPRLAPEAGDGGPVGEVARRGSPSRPTSRLPRMSRAA